MNGEVDVNEFLFTNPESFEPKPLSDFIAPQGQEFVDIYSPYYDPTKDPNVDIYSPFYNPKEGTDFITPSGRESLQASSSNSLSGYLNSVANLLPAISKIFSRDSGTQGQAFAYPSNRTLGGISPQTRTGSLMSPATQSSNMMWLILAGVAVLFLLIMKR